MFFNSIAMPSLPTLVFSVLAVLVAAFIRGYSGFGFSMITTMSLSLVFSPSLVVPAVLLMEIAASSWMLPKVWKQVDWASLRWLFIGAVIGTPLGVYLLANVPDRPMRAAIASIVAIMVVFLWRGYALKKMPGKGMILTTGTVCGVLNGGAAIGGPPAILLFFSTPTGVAVSRASLIAYFWGTDVVGTLVCAANGLITWQTLLLFAMVLPPLLVGLIMGSRFFMSTDPKLFRRIVLVLLMLLSLASLVRAVFF